MLARTASAMRPSLIVTCSPVRKSVAVMKSAVAAANNALESVQKAVKQATEVAESNFNTVAANAVNATKTVSKKR